MYISFHHNIHIICDLIGLNMFFTAEGYVNLVSHNNFLLSGSECEDSSSLSNSTANCSFPSPPIVSPLLEMGFTLKHIMKAILQTKTPGEVNAHTINSLVTWMLEHPYSETGTDESCGATGAESVRYVLYA